MSDSLWPHGLQHARLPCPSPTPRVYSNACPLSWWCHPTTSFSVVPFSSRLQSFLASGSFQMSHYFASGGQNIGVSALASVLPMNSQDWFLLGWTGWISLLFKGLSRVPHHSSKASILWHSPFFRVQLSYPYMTTGKTIALTRQTFVGKVMSLLFNMLPRLDITCDYLGKNINMWKINYNAVYTNKDYLYYASLRKKKSYFSHVKEIIQNLNYWCGLAGFNS